MHVIRPWFALVPLLAVACASGREPTPARESDGSAIVLRGSELTGTLLDAMRYRVPSMTVNLPAGECPQILFRGVRSIRNQRNPTVYVDGTRMADTCILQHINTLDVDYVELYPSGMTTRASYERSPFGLILVFRVRE